VNILKEDFIGQKSITWGSRLRSFMNVVSFREILPGVCFEARTAKEYSIAKASECMSLAIIIGYSIVGVYLLIKAFKK
jgi:hypothetical protein